MSDGSFAPLVENCQEEAGSGWCRACNVGYRTLAGRCVKQCPSEGFYEVSPPSLLALSLLHNISPGSKHVFFSPPIFRALRQLL